MADVGGVVPDRLKVMRDPRETDLPAEEAAAAPRPRSEFFERVRSIALTLTGWPSATGTPDEAAFGPKLARWLEEQPVLAEAGAEVRLEPLSGDPMGRANVLASVRGRGRKTVLLCGHFDTVPARDYGDLERLALDPDRLRPALIERLRASGASPLALADLESGAFLPGRGLLDMKSGLAAAVGVLEAFAATPDRFGNLLLVATPDEEEISAGMRAAADMLPSFLAARGLDVALAINLDALSDQGSGERGRVAALGGIGKLLLSALVIGKEAHACYPLDGVNAAYLAAEIAAEIEFAPELGEESGAELASPPAALALRDLKEGYNVTTPGRVWATWNILFQRRSTADLLDRAKALVECAIDRARTRMTERGARLANAVRPGEAWSSVPIWLYRDLHARACERSPAFAGQLDACARTLAAESGLDLPARCRLLAERTWEAAGLDGPAVVLGFASMPYPAIRWPEGGEPSLRAAIASAVRETAGATAAPIALAEHLEIISDMSFLGSVDAESLRLAASMTPAWDVSIGWKVSSSRPTPGFPTINIGPWGRDYHHWLERVHAPYAFDVLPRLVQAVAEAALRPDGRS